MDQPIPLTSERKKYTGAAGRILSLIIGGCTQVQAAKAIGVTEGFVSQLCAEHDFQLQIAEAIKADLEKAITIDANYLEIEKALSERLKTATVMMVTPTEILRTLKTINSMQPKTQRATGVSEDGVIRSANGTASGVSRLQLPNVIVQQFILNPQNEVVSVGDRALETLNSASMDSLLANKRANPKVIPSTATRIDTYEQPKDRWSDL